MSTLRNTLLAAAPIALAFAATSAHACNCDANGNPWPTQSQPTAPAAPTTTNNNNTVNPYTASDSQSISSAYQTQQAISNSNSQAGVANSGNNTSEAGVANSGNSSSEAGVANSGNSQSQSGVSNSGNSSSNAQGGSNTNKITTTAEGGAGGSSTLKDVGNTSLSNSGNSSNTNKLSATGGSVSGSGNSTNRVSSTSQGGSVSGVSAQTGAVTNTNSVGGNNSSYNSTYQAAANSVYTPGVQTNATQANNCLRTKGGFGIGGSTVGATGGINFGGGQALICNQTTTNGDNNDAQVAIAALQAHSPCAIQLDAYVETAITRNDYSVYKDKKGNIVPVGTKGALLDTAATNAARDEAHDTKYLKLYPSACPAPVAPMGQTPPPPPPLTVVKVVRVPEIRYRAAPSVHHKVLHRPVTTCAAAKAQAAKVCTAPIVGS